MQSVAVFVALLAAVSATSLVYSGVQTPVVSYLQQQPITTYSQVGASGIVQTVSQNGQQLYSVNAQAVPAYQQQVYRSPVVASTYAVPASVYAAGTPSNTYTTYAGVSPINYGYSIYGK